MKIEKWPIDRVKPYLRNVKKHTDDQVLKIANSIKQFGWDQPIVVDADGVIIKGHGRRLAAIALGATEVPILVRTDLTPQQVRAARLADNRTALGDIDTALMREEIKDLDLAPLTGIFDDKELDFATADLGDMVDGAFIDDVDRAVEEQESETRGKVDTLQKERVSVAKAFGFKDIQGANEIWYARFVTVAEQKTGLKGEEAVTQYIKAVVEAISHE